MGKNNAWSFGSTHSSFDGFVTIFYFELHEFGSGSPLAGNIRIDVGEHSYTPEEEFGGPPVFDKDGRHFAIPVWTSNHNQQLIVVDCLNRRMLYLPRQFRVLELDDFRDSTISGIDSPVHKPFPFTCQLADFIEYEKF